MALPKMKAKSSTNMIGERVAKTSSSGTLLILSRFRRVMIAPSPRVWASELIDVPPSGHPLHACRLDIHFMLAGAVVPGARNRAGGSVVAGVPTVFGPPATGGRIRGCRLRG